MAKETSAILRSALYQVQTAKTLEEAVRAIKAMCDGDDIAHVAQLLAEVDDERT